MAATSTRPPIDDSTTLIPKKLTRALFDREITGRAVRAR